MSQGAVFVKRRKSLPDLQSSKFLDRDMQRDTGADTPMSRDRTVKDI